MSLRTQAREIFANQRTYQALNAFVSYAENSKKLDAKIKQADERVVNGNPHSTIDGCLIAIKDNICTQGEPTTCASRILKDYASPYTATVVRKLEAAGALIHGKTNLDEFGMGSHSIHSIHGKVKSHLGDPNDPFSAGGSSGGSAVAVATGQCYAALGTDTGGSVRLPAAYTGVVGFKPSYGLVSRYGVIAYANSLDTVGVLAESSQRAQQIYNVIQGYDVNDPTSASENTRHKISKQYAQKRGDKPRRLRIGVPKECNIKELDPIVRQAWIDTLVCLRHDNDLISVALPTTQAALAAYYILAPAEASSNLAKYDGVRYGSKLSDRQATESVLYSSTRGDGLGEEVRRRILLGSFSLSAAAMNNYFLKAQKVRRLVQQDFNRVFAAHHPLLDYEQEHKRMGVDVIITPTAPSLPPTLSSVAGAAAVETYLEDVFTVPSSLAGLPAITVPVPVDCKGLDRDDPHCGVKTTGLQIIGQYGADESLFEVAKLMEDIWR